MKKTDGDFFGSIGFGSSSESVISCSSGVGIIMTADSAAILLLSSALRLSRRASPGSYRVLSAPQS